MTKDRKRQIKIKKIKHKSIKALRKKAWKLMSEYRRRKANGVCWTCGDRKDWRLQDAGHYIHKDCLDYEDINIHCQCSRCNRFLNGNLGVYAEKMIKTYGQEAVEGLRLKSQQIKKWTVEELEMIIDCLGIKIEEQNRQTLHELGIEYGS